MWLPLLSRCNLQSLTPLFLCQFFFLLTLQDLFWALSNVSSGEIKFEIFLCHLVYLDGLFLPSDLTSGIQM